jgi:lipoate-protein ligase A
MDCRLIIDEPASGAWNMAMDEALLDSAGSAQSAACMRFYFWEQPTVSLGYFQSHEDRRQHQSSQDCPIVRRSTGGGAIVHDVELTYSFTSPIPSHAAGDLRAWYAAFHQTLIEELLTMGVGASLCNNPPHRPAKAEPFLCFQRRAEGDVLLGDAKIAGSAQRRRKRALLQHGSVLLERSIRSPELPAIEELTGFHVDALELAMCWANRLARQIGLSLTTGQPTGDELQLARRLYREKFADACWTCRR